MPLGVPRRRRSVWWLPLLCLLLPVDVLASLAGVSADSIGLPIDQFRVSGNVKTQEKYLIHWTELEIGQILTIDALNHALQELRNTDLYKSIQFQTERLENGELTLHIIVEERRSWLLLPRASRNNDGDIKGGFRLRMYNLQGADRTLDLLAQQEQETNDDVNNEFRMVYTLPMLSKPYDLTWRLSRLVENKEVEGFENVETIDYFAFNVSRDWQLDFFRTPLTIGTAIELEDRDLEQPYPDDIEAREAGQHNRLRLSLIFDGVNRERYRRFGDYYALSIGQGFDWLGSDYDSTVVEIEVNGFKRLNFYDNFNYRVVFEVSNDSPFNYLRYSVGGGSTIRGLENFGERGDARWFGNFEWVIAYRKKPGIAHTLFVDLGNVYDSLEDIDPGDFHYTVGTGFRWKIESFVKTDLFVDYGYDPDAGEGRFYGGTSLNF